MQFKYKPKHNNLTAAVIWFLVCGVAFAYADGVNVKVEVPGAVSPETKKFDDDATALLARVNATVAASVSGEEANTAAAIQGHINRNYLDSTQVAAVTGIGPGWGMTNGQSTVAMQTIEYNQAVLELSEAADTFSKTLTLAVYDKYKNLTHEEAIALWVEEGIRYGYLRDDPSVYSDAKKNFPSFISKAMASTGGGGNDKTYDAKCKKNGRRMKIEGIQKRADFPGPAKSPDADIVQGCIWAGMEGRVVEETSGSTENGKGNRSPTANADDSKEVNQEQKIQKDVAQIAENIGANGVVSNGGGPSADNSDHSSFFISSAYAQSSPPWGQEIPIVERTADLGFTQEKTCQKAQAAVLSGPAGCSSGSVTDNSSFFISNAYASTNNRTSKVWAETASDCGDAAYGSRLSYELANSYVAAADVGKVVADGQRGCRKRYEND